MPVKTYTFRIQQNRKTPDGRLTSRWMEYQVKGTETTTILTLLEEIK
ncbi:MAG: hypothetical protein HQL93_11565, partial [Magnetococcales bacterium]|nr:hypothetical protein [Magnetococcales bacterium]